MNKQPSKFNSNELFARFYRTARLYEKETPRDLKKAEKTIIRMMLDIGENELKARLINSGNTDNLVNTTLLRHRRALNKARKRLGLEA